MEKTIARCLPSPRLPNASRGVGWIRVTDFWNSGGDFGLCSADIPLACQSRKSDARNGNTSRSDERRCGLRYRAYIQDVQGKTLEGSNSLGTITFRILRTMLLTNFQTAFLYPGLAFSI